MLTTDSSSVFDKSMKVDLISTRLYYKLQQANQT